MVRGNGKNPVLEKSNYNLIDVTVATMIVLAAMETGNTVDITIKSNTAADNIIKRPTIHH